MSSLIDIQNQFQDYLLNSNNTILDEIIPSNKVSADIRLSIYTNAYQSRLQEALAANYPILNIYLGDEQFKQLANKYIDVHPSSFQSIRWFGNELPSFLIEQPEYQPFSYLAELAQFEWTCGLVFDAEDSQTLQVNDMNIVPIDAWPNMQFQAHPSAFCLSLNWNVVAIWQALTDNQQSADPHYQTEAINWIVWRKNFSSHFTSLLNDEAWAIQAMLQGSTFGEICAGICQWHDEQNAGQHAASLLKGWIEAGLIKHVIY